MAAVAILKSVSVTLSALMGAVGDQIKGLPTRVKGLGLSPKAGDSFVVKKGTEPVLTTVDGSAPLKQSGSELQYAPGAYWSIEGTLVAEDGHILDEHVALAQKRCEQQLDDLILADDGAGDVLLERGNN